jgi:hypothetical protein
LQVKNIKISIYMSAYLEVLAFCLGYALLHQGVAQVIASKMKRRAVCFMATGVGVFFLGAIYWHLNSDASTRLAETQSLSVAQPNLAQQKIDLEGMELSQRRLASLKLANIQPKNRSYPAPARAGGGCGKTVWRVICSQM